MALVRPETLPATLPSAPATPVAIVEACSTARERSLTLTLAQMAAGDAQAWLDPAEPSLLMIGDAFAERARQASAGDPLRNAA